jgi:UDP-N-acetylmuramate dehydrogenase
LGRYVVLNAAFRLSLVPRPDLSYKDLATRFKDATPTLQELHDAVVEIRKNKFPDLAVEGTAGSFFKNPVLPLAEAKKLQEKYPEMPVFALPESTDIKIPLGWLLDYRHGVLDMREIKVGGARMYEKQFLVIAAAKNTVSSDIKALAREVQKKLFDVCGISVEPEVYFVE